MLGMYIHICINLFSLYVPLEIIKIFFQLISVHSNELLWHHGDQRFKWKTPSLDAVSSSNDPCHWMGLLLPVLDLQHHILQSPPLKSWVQSWEIKSQVFHLFLGEKGQIPRLPSWRWNRVWWMDGWGLRMKMNMCMINYEIYSMTKLNKYRYK